jgi:hypothetical protein
VNLINEYLYSTNLFEGGVTHLISLIRKNGDENAGYSTLGKKYRKDKMHFTDMVEDPYRLYYQNLYDLYDDLYKIYENCY